MSDDKLCRICMRKDVKMYECDRFQLKVFYIEITGSKISKRDGLPKWFCYECAALLYKFHEFRKRCHNGQKAFKKLLESKSVARHKLTKPPQTSIQSYLQILSVNINKSIKTYTVKYDEPAQTKKLNIFTEVYVDDLKIAENISKLNKKEDKRPKGNFIADNDYSDNDFGINDESNDSLPLHDDAECTGIKIRIDDKVDINIGNEKINNARKEMDSNEKTNIFDEEAANIRQRDKVKTDYENSYDVEEIDVIQSEPTDLKERKDADQSLVNKFQRSVKKKFLDENHWKKITLTDEEASRRFQSKALEQKYLKADFKCTDCYRTFSQEDMKKRHIKLRHCESLGPHECRHCRMRFKWKSRLQKHLKEHFTIYKCLRCELSFPVEISAFQHDYSHNGVTWTCAHCGQGFRHSSTYYTHLRKHKSKYVCTLCGVSFVSEFGLFMHKRVKHVINEDTKEESSITYCKVCDIQFDTLKGFNEHFAESALHATEVADGATSLPLKTKCTRRRVPRIATNCNICLRTFSTYVAFSKHHAQAHAGAPRPRARERMDGQKQVCEVCGLTLASSWSLLNHLNTHSRVRLFTCKTCGLQLSSRSVLQRHQLTHTHDKSFSCDRCERRFTHGSGLRLHMKTHDKKHASISRKRKAEPIVMEYIKNYGHLQNNFTRN